MPPRSRLLRPVLALIALVQLVLGVVFIALPWLFIQAEGLAEPPAWTGWVFAMFGARALGFALGMGLAAWDPARHRSWLPAMVLVQAVDWIGTMAYVLAGSVTLAQVSTASVLPLVFIVVLVRGYSRLGPAESR